ncbi:class I SAM-dependent DNA methyltransferase [Pedobacter antarcticus]|uniref:class I SAM-dependent DNA methyltransferase n=1 Tax=Pedobacter antarcticus TaxID=34086 RepID=UPI00292FD39B|nr:DNA methyltransferase [Pedobacter antarcticus]
MNAVEIEEAISLLAEQPFVPTEFPYAFLEAFGNKETTIKRLRTGNNNKSDIQGGVLQQNNIHIAVCEVGRVTETLEALKNSIATVKAKAKFLLATDGREFHAEHHDSGETIACEYSAFHNYFGFFLPLAGINTVKQIRENAFDIKATSRLNKLYIELLRHNPEWTTAERRHDMNHFLARLIFCFFAEDTDIFKEKGLFTETVQKMSATDASDTHEIIGEIFRTMDIKPVHRAEENTRNWANKFPYVNGELFSGSIETPKFTKIARSYLLHVGNLDWKKINPDIFGSMIQAVADDDERGALGMHYTSVPNILKVLNPLFLDDLRAQLNEANNNFRKLLNLRKRISRIRVFDPACGSGNFLVIAYKQMREIEFEINRQRGELNLPSEIPLTNFRGIELRDFSAEVARLALIIAEYQCDLIYRGQKLALAEFLPLNAENWITVGNALEINWNSVCPPTGTNVTLHSDDLFSPVLRQPEIDFQNQGGETYICGNPPYLGSQDQTPKQKKDLEIAFEGSIKSTKSADYVSGWFIKARRYVALNSGCFAFVTTNSICQGRQVELFWPAFLKSDLEIRFAEPSFLWSNLATKKAAVIVSIIGIGPKSQLPKKLFDNGHVLTTGYIGPYLVPDHDTIVSSSRNVISDLTSMTNGSMPNDGGGLLLSSNEYRYLIASQPQVAKYCRKFLGSADSIQGDLRYCLWIGDEESIDAKNIPEIARRIDLVSEHRLKSSRPETNSLASIPYAFGERRHKEGITLLIPRHSSEKRPYLPSIIVDGSTVVGDSAIAMYDMRLLDFAIYSSKMHLVWAATVCGKIKEDYRYSNTLGWNTFPLPTLTAKNRSDLTDCAKEILIARERHFPASIADLYDPESMPDDLRYVHEQNDEVLERIYIGRRFKNDTERLEKLFDLYTKITKKGNFK